MGSEPARARRQHRRPKAAPGYRSTINRQGSALRRNSSLAQSDTVKTATNDVRIHAVQAPSSNAAMKSTSVDPVRLSCERRGRFGTGHLTWKPAGRDRRWRDLGRRASVVASATKTRSAGDLYRVVVRAWAERPSRPAGPRIPVVTQNRPLQGNYRVPREPAFLPTPNWLDSWPVSRKSVDGVNWRDACFTEAIRRYARFPDPPRPPTQPRRAKWKSYVAPDRFSSRSRNAGRASPACESTTAVTVLRAFATRRRCVAQPLPWHCWRRPTRESLRTCDRSSRAFPNP